MTNLKPGTGTSKPLAYIQRVEWEFTPPDGEAPLRVCLELSGCKLSITLGERTTVVAVPPDSSAALGHMFSERPIAQRG